MEYKIIIGAPLEDFQREINQNLSEGWSLYHGPIYFGIWDGYLQYAQAMILNFTEPFRVVTGVEGEMEAAADAYWQYGYRPLGKPQRTGKMVEIDGEEFPECAWILKKKDES